MHAFKLIVALIAIGVVAFVAMGIHVECVRAQKQSGGRLSAETAAFAGLHQGGLGLRRGKAAESVTHA
jgi:hypothetical protein